MFLNVALGSLDLPRLPLWESSAVCQVFLETALSSCFDFSLLTSYITEQGVGHGLNSKIMFHFFKTVLLLDRYIRKKTTHFLNSKLFLMANFQKFMYFETGLMLSSQMFLMILQNLVLSFCLCLQSCPRANFPPISVVLHFPCIGFSLYWNSFSQVILQKILRNLTGEMET